MTVSELIKKLQEIEAQGLGDLNVTDERIVILNLLKNSKENKNNVTVTKTKLCEKKHDNVELLQNKNDTKKRVKKIVEVLQNKNDAKKRVEEIKEELYFTVIDDIQIETHIIQKYL